MTDTPATPAVATTGTSTAPIDLATHEQHSVARAEAITTKLSKLNKNIKGISTMANGTTTQPAVNVFGSGLGGTGGTSAGGVLGGAFGGGAVGALLGGALNNGGLFGGGNNAAAQQLQTENAIAASTALSNARFDALAQGNIESAIQSTAAATQLAQQVSAAANTVAITKNQTDASVQSALNAAAIGVQVQKTAGDTQTQIATQTAALGVQTQTTAAANALAIAMGQRDIELGISNAAAQGAALAAQLAAQQALTAQQAATQLAATQYTLATAIKTDGDLTRAILIANNDAELNRRLVIQAAEITELRNEGRRSADNADVRLQITNVNTAVAAQAQTQAQLQQQQQQNLIGNLSASVAALIQQNQNIHASIVNLGSGSVSGSGNNTQVR